MDLSVGLMVACGCIGTSHRPTCQLITRLPTKTTAWPGKYFIEIGVFRGVEAPEGIKKIKLPVCYQFDVTLQSPIYNRVDDDGCGLAYAQVFLSPAGHTFVKNVLHKMSDYYGSFEFHKNYKLFLADTVIKDKVTMHFEPFTISIGGFCVVKSSGNYTVEFMNKRPHFWTYGLGTLDGATTNNKNWTNNIYNPRRLIFSSMVMFFLVILLPLLFLASKDPYYYIHNCCKDEIRFNCTYLSHQSRFQGYFHD